MHDIEPLHTARLTLIAATASLARAAVSDHPRLARDLGAMVPSTWPPPTLADVQEMIALSLEANPSAAGWLSWFIIAREVPGVDQPTLVGTAGAGSLTGPPVPGQPIHFGYGILDEFHRRGIASEAAMALVHWAIRQPEVHALRATTFERHIASVKILERCGFSCTGVAAEDPEAPESDRLGRGRLLEFLRQVR